MNFPVRNLTKRLRIGRHSSKNALFQKIIKPEISPKDRTEFQEKTLIFWFLRVDKMGIMQGNTNTQTAVFRNWKRGLCLLGSTQNIKISRKWPHEYPPMPSFCSPAGLSPKLRTLILLVGKHSKPRKNIKIIPKNHENSQIRSDP